MEGGINVEEVTSYKNRALVASNEGKVILYDPRNRQYLEHYDIQVDSTIEQVDGKETISSLGISFKLRIYDEKGNLFYESKSPGSMVFEKP